jgi:hypothetical protein
LTKKIQNSTFTRIRLKNLNQILNVKCLNVQADVEFLSGLHIMDYSLLLGVHNVDAAEDEEENEDLAEGEDGDEEEGLDEEYDSAASGGVALTPPDSPRPCTRSPGRSAKAAPPPAATTARGKIDPDKDIYAIPSRASSQKREIYFLALVDILTHYGVKKQAAKVAKTVKYGSSSDGISTVDPEQYAARFLEFVSNAIE